MKNCKKMSYPEMAQLFIDRNKGNKKAIDGYIVFAQNSFSEFYPERSRTYVVSSDNKAFKPDANGYSIFGSCLDGTDQNVRLDGYMRDCSKPWKIEACYISEYDLRKNLIIKRVVDGREMEFELTDAEIEDAYRQREKEYRVEDAKAKWCEMHDGQELGYDNAEFIAEQAERILNNHDTYWDCYWDCFSVAIEEFELMD